MKVNNGVDCMVRTCKYHGGGNICNLQKINVSSDMNDKHYCKSFEERPSVPEF